MPFINVIIMNISKDKIHMSEDTGYSSNTSKCVLDQLTLQRFYIFSAYVNVWERVWSLELSSRLVHVLPNLLTGKSLEDRDWYSGS